MIGLAVYWWGVAVFWFVILIVLLPSQIQKLVGDERKGEVLGIICLFSALFSVGLAPVFGLLSDNCSHRWGRRRPFLVMGTCGVVCSLFGMILSKDIYFFGGFYVVMQVGACRRYNLATSLSLLSCHLRRVETWRRAPSTHWCLM